ncbi:family 43 glycosylhydrolase [Nocardioides caeni]|uniref:Beta-xylosidase n=1 Tax=Nocardioides caeni TaxID=574700 RepID=A0A4S8N0J6_9ACTN|nr:family 43 glycosylhydrolase [Nocardioides caeni]THV09288.1 beta-xylosidase [Nocardioides caeni]
MSHLSTALRRLPALLALALVGALLLLVPTARPALAADVTEGLVLRYDLDQTSGTTVADTSGNGRDGTLVGGSWDGDGLALDGVDDHVQLPANITAGLDAITVHVDVFVEASQATPFFLWGLGNPATSGAGTGYLFASGNAFRAGITTGNWSGEKVTARTSGGNLARGVWKSVTYTQTGTTGTLFEDGAQVGQNTAVTVLPSAIGGGTTTNNVLGESNYATDNSLEGRIRNFRIYDRALDASEVAQLAELDTPVELGDQEKADADADAIELVHPDDVRGSLTLPVSGSNGSTIDWASDDPAVVASDGVVVRPAHGAGDATVTLTATVTVGSATATREIELTVRESPAPAPYAGYAFSYFTNNSIAGEKIYFAASRGNDALQWDELNDGQPVLESTMGEMGLRDPFLIRSPEGDRFFLIATDLSIGRNGDWDRSQRTGSRHLEVWESTDLKNWSAQRHVLVSPETAGNTWAPEAYWDEDLQQFVVFWASKIYAEDDPNHTGSTYNRMLYATTRDFVTFSEAKVWQDIGSSRIDSTVIKDNGTYYRFTKDEGAGTTGCSDIIQEKNDSLTEPDLVGSKAWSFQEGCIGKNAGTSAVEGPTVFEANPGDDSGSNFYLFVDEYGGRGYIPLGTDDLENPDWQVAPAYDLPASPRHGTVIPVTQAELDSLREGIVVPEPPTPVEADEDGLVAHYELDETTGSVAADSSGHGYDGTVSGDTTWADGGLTLGGTNGHVKLPDDMMAGLEAITVSTEVWVDTTQPTPYFIWGLGNTDNGGTGNGYLFTTGNGAYRTSIASGNWTTEQTATSGAALGRGAWKTLIYTLQDGTATIYLDGVKVGEKTGVTIEPGDIGNGRTSANYIGRSVYTGDKYLKGKVRDFRLWNRALTGTEVRDLAADPTAILGVELSSLKVPAVIDSASSTITLPVEPGTDLTALAPSYDVKAGSILDVDGAADHSSPRTVTVTAPDGATRAWTVRAVEMRSPVLPGLYADPNIAVFDGVFYLYATTDGLAGWGGKDFYVWKSTNLVDWERSEQPFLTLDGANGNVPWASGNAWAPTIIERGQKFYFYFSGHNPTYNRKTIGVAVADSPEGPFTAQPEAMILNNEAVTSGQAIDPAAFQDPATGKYYLFWGNGSPVYAELSDDMLSIKAETLAPITGLTSFREGAFVNHRDGIYHLTYAIDDTGSPDYRVGYATATSIDGPWTYRGVILQKDASQGILGTGHSSIVNAPGTDDWYIAYHRFAMPGGDGTHRETTIDRLTFGEDGLMQVVTPTLTSVDPLEEPEPEAPVNEARPAVTGSAQVGRRLTAGTGTWDQSDLDHSFQWLRDGSPISGATSASYTVRGGDVGHRLSVRVTATPAAGPSGTATSLATAAVRKAGATVRLRLSDTTPRARQRLTLRITVGTTPAGVTAAGRVVVRVDGRQVAVRVLRSGVATVTLRLPRGRHTITAAYAGSSSVARDGAVLRVRVR